MDSTIILYFSLMGSGVIIYKNSKVHYRCFGDGQKTVVCFHGYGEDAGVFSFMERYSHDYKFLVFDMPFHGLTEWNEGNDFRTEDLVAINKMMLEKEEVGCKIRLLGFSMGGRIALGLYQEIPEQVSAVILLAPDGLKVNFWYWLSTQTFAGNKLFALTMKHPEWFFGFIKVANGIGAVNTSIYKFIHYYIGDKNVRDLLYKRWTSMRHITPAVGKIKGLIRKYKTIAKLVYGKHDRIILPVRGEKFIKGIEAFAEITVIESGHQVLHEKHAKDIATIIDSTQC